MSKKPDDISESNKSHEILDNAIEQGNDLIAAGKPKIEAAMSIYVALLGEPQDAVVSAFIEGAALTPKGAVTYWYNCRRKHNRTKSSTTA